MKKSNFRFAIMLLACSTVWAISQVAADELPSDVQANQVDSKTPQNFQSQNLVAWCIVPFDAKRRGPQKRAAMLKSLGLRRIAYDWRDEHVPTFEAEILACKANDIEFFAFWNWHADIEPLIGKHKIHPQIWMTNPSPNADTQQEKIEAAAASLLPTVEKAGQPGCKFGLYNHGGWGGEPENLVAVCQYLRQHHSATHVGIVYNFHHAHERIATFGKDLERIKPYLLCLNLNGMNDTAQPKILPIGDGIHESEMIREVIRSGYQGPIGILDHRNEVDSQESLRANIEGLEKVLSKLESPQKK